jgi:hypothetical protein
MENRIVIKNLGQKLNQVVLHEQVENGVAINNNLSAYQRFETPRIVFQTDKRHLQIEKRPEGHITPQATLIILREMQTSEAHKRTNSLQQNFKREECKIENADSQVEFKQMS